MLKPGGVFSCLEFGKVNVPFLAEAYKQYSFNVLPPLGQMLAGDRASYQYLVESIERFPTQPQFARMMKEAGFHLPGSPTATSLGFLPSLAAHQAAKTLQAHGRISRSVSPPSGLASSFKFVSALANAQSCHHAS